MTTIEMEYYVARYFNWRKNLIVPNISWGLFKHECDLLILTKSGYATEIEIKISKNDLKKDFNKKHRHIDKDWYGNECDKIKYLYYALPGINLIEDGHEVGHALENKFLDCENLIPEQAGLLLVGEGGYVYKKREAKSKSDYKFTEQERFNIARLGTMRIWNLKYKRIEQIRKKS